MGSKSPVSGVSGAVRIQRLSGVSFAAAEAHGKRLDTIGKARAVIEDAPPITTTGLNLANLYADHAKGAKVQKSGTKALHLVLQFPKDLVDGEDGQTMLRHARDFAASVFGPEAIFADRVDRDEKSRHVVDLFLAPKYEKITKRRSQAAITTSKHLKDLAAARGKAPTLRGQGQALQDAWFEYLRDRMQLDVARGAPKQQPGDDWQTPEQLELERLREEQAGLRSSLGYYSSQIEPVREAYREEWRNLRKAEEATDNARKEAQRATQRAEEVQRATEGAEAALRASESAAQRLVADAEAEAAQILTEARQRAADITEKNKQLRSWAAFTGLLKTAIREVFGEEGYRKIADRVNPLWANDPDNPDRKPDRRPSSGPSAP